MKKIEFKKVHVIIPVFNAEHHITRTLENLDRVLNEINFSYRVSIVDDQSEDLTVRKIEKFMEVKKKNWRILKPTSKLGQQRAILLGMRKSEKEEIVVVMDDDMLISKEIFKSIIQPLLNQNNDLVVINQPANGLRNLTSSVYWYCFQLIAGEKFTGRELMLRAVSPELVSRILIESNALLSISQSCTDFTRGKVILSDVKLKYTQSKSRYTKIDRIKLFTELIIISRKELGITLILVSITMYLIYILIFLFLGIIGSIEIVSRSSIISYFVVTLGTFNLIAIGVAQVSLSLLYNMLKKNNG